MGCHCLLPNIYDFPYIQNLQLLSLTSGINYLPTAGSCLAPQGPRSRGHPWFKLQPCPFPAVTLGRLGTVLGFLDCKQGGQDWYQTCRAQCKKHTWKHTVQVSSVAQSCPTLCDPMSRSTPGLPVHHQLPEFTQTHVHRVSDAIQPSHPLSSPSPPAPNPSQHQSLFQ